ncbi:hypothetical protein [Ruminococcus sp. JL13D9]|jgi:hypothetical protein|uniref:hypothetical protein n=1 Tax=Ruminococcus sp. JL13D9 TaxID=3233381 RepID=UPI00389AAF7E
MRKIIGILLSLSTVLAVFGAGCLNAFALGATPVTANEGKVTVWVFAVIITVVAIAGIVYFIIQHKNKK